MIEIFDFSFLFNGDETDNDRNNKVIDWVLKKRSKWSIGFDIKWEMKDSDNLYPIIFYDESVNSPVFNDVLRDMLMEEK